MREEHRTGRAGLTFEQLALAYNFESTPARGRVFADLVINEARRAPETSPATGSGRARILDIGCGKGIELDVDLQRAIRPHVLEYWGLEPDRTIPATPGLFDHYEHAPIEDAALPADYFDMAYSFMVMEHVTAPERFLQAVHRCLKPGGVYLFATPNRRHYFTRIAAALHRLRLEETTLRLIARRHAEESHYPVKYLCNDQARIDRLAAAAGFQPPEYVYLEDSGPKYYFPRPLRFIYHGLRLKRKMIQRPRALLVLIGRLRKPVV